MPRVGGGPGVAFVDLLSCAFGAVILALMLSIAQTANAGRSDTRIYLVTVDCIYDAVPSVWDDKLTVLGSGESPRQLSTNSDEPAAHIQEYTDPEPAIRAVTWCRISCSGGEVSSPPRQWVVIAEIRSPVVSMHIVLDNRRHGGLPASYQITVHNTASKSVVVRRTPEMTGSAGQSLRITIGPRTLISEVGQVVGS